MRDKLFVFNANELLHFSHRHAIGTGMRAVASESMSFDQKNPNDFFF